MFRALSRRSMTRALPMICAALLLPILAISEVKAVMPQADPHHGHDNGHGAH